MVPCADTTSAEIEIELGEPQLANLRRINGADGSLLQSDVTFRQQLALDRPFAEIEIEPHALIRQAAQVQPGRQRSRHWKIGQGEGSQLGRERSQGGRFHPTDLNGEIDGTLIGGIAIAGVEFGVVSSERQGQRYIAGKALRVSLDQGIHPVGLPTSARLAIVIDQGGVADDDVAHQPERPVRIWRARELVENVGPKARRPAVRFAKAQLDRSRLVAHEMQ
jgi:hypothetical protein